jgi:hypothetical protein
MLAASTPLPASSNEMDANAKFEVPPRSVCRVNGSAQGNPESQARPISKRQAECSCLCDKIPRSSGLLNGKGNRLVNGSMSGVPGIIRAKAPLKEFPMHLGQIDSASRGCIHDLRRQYLGARLAVNDGHQS